MKKISNLTGALAGFLVLVAPYLARATDDDAKQLVTYVHDFYMGLLLPVGTVLAGFVIMYAGIVYAMSAGDPGKTGVAKEYIIGAVSGLALLLTAAMIINTLIK